MASFTALNIEPAEDIQEEVDDTKEIQIEEALKLYQNALKLHSQGPEFYAQAREAYDALLQSEIFKYPESISDFLRNTLPDTDTDDAAAEELAEIDINDAAASALPQTIYLSYKNSGQFLLDTLKETLRQDPTATSAITKESRSALAMFADALERDDTDLDLWRKTARLGEALNSFRLARYCLESVLVGDDNEVEVRPEQLGLDEALARENLQEVLRIIVDPLSISQAPPSKQPRQALLRFAKRHMQDPYSYLPKLPKEISTTSILKKWPPSNLEKHRIIASEDKTWYAVGKALLESIIAEEQRPEQSTTIGISIPSKEESPMSPKQVHSSVAQKDVEMSEAPVDIKSTTETVQPQPAPASLDPADDQSSIDQRAESQLRESLEGISKDSTGSPNAVVEAQPAEDGETKTSHANPRKRSSASVGNEEMADGGRAKSRRTRARESNAENLLQSEDAGLDQKYYDDRLEDLSHADQWMFGTVGSILSKIGVEELGSIEDLKSHVCTASTKSGTELTLESQGEPDLVLANDLRYALTTWDDEKSRSAMQGDSSTALQDIRGMNRSGLAIFQEHSRKPMQKPGKHDLLDGGSGLEAFVEEVNNDRIQLYEVAFSWLCRLVQSRGSDPESLYDGSLADSLYITTPWSDSMKEIVTKILTEIDDYLYRRLSLTTSELEQEILDHSTKIPDTPFIYTNKHYTGMETIEAFYELHLDNYARINNPNSEVDLATRVAQRDRLGRWGSLAQTAVNHLINHGPGGDCCTKITLRFLWSTTFHSNMADDVSREHMLLCLHDLKRTLEMSEIPEIYLINNTVMPEISVSALDQEISRLNSMDFFMKIFGSETENSVSLIESIEPILDPSSVEFVQGDEASGINTTLTAPSHFKELTSFLDGGDATLRLFLWRRLQDAYRDIDYMSKVVWCELRSIEAIVKEIRGKSFLEGAYDTRPSMLLRWLKSINNILVKLLPRLIQNPAQSFECLDLEQLRSSMAAVAHISRLLHTFALHEDLIRVGLRTSTEPRGVLKKSLENFKDKLRDMQVRCWVLQYTLVREYMSQEGGLFDSPSDDRIQFLRAVHNALGVRSACKYADKVLLRLMKSELLSVETNEDCEFDIAQVLFDLHGFKFSNQIGTMDHGCPTERLDRESAAMMVDFVLMQVNRLNIKDLSKSDLKTTIEKVQQAIGPIRHSSISFNKRVISAYLKSPINPPELFRLSHGIGGLALTSVSIPNAENAKKGWYFLLGHASLTKFRSQKRSNPGPTNDLDDAITYFRQDLEYATERWETWYRLAQAYDSKLDEEITWTADKINNNMSELVTLQRNAIHCYAMAVAGALQEGDDDHKSRATMSELFTDYGIRLYASSREPFNMAAFNLTDFERHYSNIDSQKLYTDKPFREMRLYAVWGLASYLFRRAMVGKPDYWVNHFMLSKCRWKMFNSDETMRGNTKEVTLDMVLDPLLDAIETLPRRKEKTSDPILEPHFRLVSVLHKLVVRQKIDPKQAAELLSETPWAKKLSPPEKQEDWRAYILSVLKHLKNADKSNWHHRIMLRIARIHCDSPDDPGVAAAAAKNELMPQIFTKTMTLQVWRPEFERPGRHFVYTTRYIYFFIKLLDQLNDKVSLEQLLRRVRKKQGDFINHTKLWEDMCILYVKLIRRSGNIPERQDEGIFKLLSWDDFVANSARLDSLKDLATTSGPTLDLLREAVELKKLNNNLMKVTMLEDLTADTYARLYEENKHRFIEQANEENRERMMKVDHLLMNADGPGEEAAATTSAAPSEAPAVNRGRTKGIARRDIQKRADAIVSRYARPAAAKPSTAFADEEKPQSATIARTSATSNAQDTATESVPAVQNSVPGSLHDSADDESELSEIDEEKLDKLTTDSGNIFPNLKKSIPAPDPASERSIAASVVDDDEAATTVTADAVPLAEDGGDDLEQDQVGDIEGETVMTAEEDEEEQEEEEEEGGGEGEETELQAEVEDENVPDAEVDPEVMDEEEPEQADGEDETEVEEAEGDATEVGDETMVDLDEEQAEGEELGSADVKEEEEGEEGNSESAPVADVLIAESEPW